MAHKDISHLAVVAPGSILGEGVRVEPFAVIEDNVVIGDRVHVHSHAHVRSGARIGADCTLFTGASVGATPQDLKFSGGETLAVVGERTVVREYATIERGTEATGTTIVGSDSLIMTYVHIAHDCVVGNNVIVVSGTQVGGHVQVDDWAIVGGMVAVHQFAHIGVHTMIGAGFKVAKDVPPYVLAGQWPLQFMGVNRIGLRRRGFTDEEIAEIAGAYRILYSAGLNVSDALARIDELPAHTPHIAAIVEFVRTSSRGLIPGPR